MATKIGSLLIEVASGVARVESDMKKISKILDANTSAWKKMFDGLKVVASGWLAKEVIREGAEALLAFAERGIDAAGRLQETKAQAEAFTAEQKKLTAAVDEFAATAVAPLLPLLTNATRCLTEAAREARAFSQWASDSKSMAFLTTLAQFTPMLGTSVTHWRLATAAVNEFGEELRKADEKASEFEQSLGRVADIVVDDFEKSLRFGDTVNDIIAQGERAEKAAADLQRKSEEQRRKAIADREKWDRDNRIRISKEIIKQMVDEAKEKERFKVESERMAYEAEHQRALERGRIVDENLAQTREGQLRLLEESKQRELDIVAGFKDAELGVLKRYKQAEQNLENSRAQNRLATQGAMYGALGQLTSVFLGEQHAITKAFAIAEAIVNMNRSVLQAMAAFPPPINFKMAAACRIAGLASIASIIATSFTGGGASGGSVSAPAGGSFSTQGSVPTTEPAATAEEKKERAQGKFEVHIYNPVGERAWFERNIVPLFTEAKRNRSFDAEVFAA